MRPQLLVAALGLALEGYVLAAAPYGRVRADGTHEIALNEFGRGSRVTQVFTAENDGLRSVRVRLWTSHRADLDLAYTFSELQGATPIERYRGMVRVADVSGAQWQSLDLPVVVRSTGGQYAIECRLTAVRPAREEERPDVALLATADRPLRHSYLIVDQKERWGSLEFEARATGDTILGRFRLRGLPQLPGSVRHFWYVIGALVAYNVLLIGLLIAIWTDTVAVPGAEAPGLPGELPGAPGLQPRGGRIVPGAQAPGLRELLPGVALSALLLAGLAALGVIWRREHAGVDLIDELYAADLQSSSPLHSTFDVVDVEIGVEQRRAIFAHPASRIAWHVMVPPGARLETAIALDPGGWRAQSDGAAFRISAVDGGRTTQLFFRYVHPSAIDADRRWIPVNVDLSAFGGRAIDLVFATEPSLPTQPANTSFDFALWGTPRVR